MELGIHTARYSLGIYTCSYLMASKNNGTDDGTGEGTRALLCVQARGNKGVEQRPADR